MTIDERLAKAMGWNYLLIELLGIPKGVWDTREEDPNDPGVTVCVGTDDWHPSSPTAPDALHQCKMVWDRLSEQQQSAAVDKVVGDVYDMGICWPNFASAMLDAPTLAAAIAAVLEDNDA